MPEVCARTCTVRDLGRMPYMDALAIQEQIAEGVSRGGVRIICSLSTTRMW